MHVLGIQLGLRLYKCIAEMPYTILLLSGYVIEKFEKKGGGDWAPVSSHIYKDPEATITNLAEGETYQFRIRAVNAAGPGAPSKATEPCMCRPYVGKSIHCTKVTDLHMSTICRYVRNPYHQGPFVN